MRRRHLAPAVALAAMAPLAGGAGCASAGPLHVLEGHDGAITSVRFHGNGELLASAGKDGVVRLWSAAEGELVREIPAHGNRIGGLAFHGDVVASASVDGTLRLWSIIDGTSRGVISGQAAWVPEAVLWRTGGAKVLLAARVTKGSDGLIALFDPDTSELVRTLAAEQDGEGDEPGVVFLDGDRYVAVAGSRLEIRAEPDGEIVRTLDARAGRPYGPTLSPSGSLVAVGGADGQVRLWSLESGRVERAIAAGDGEVWSVDFSPTGDRIVTGGSDGVVRVFAIDGKLLNRLEGHQLPVWSVAFSPSGEHVASGSDDQTVRIWRTPAP